MDYAKKIKEAFEYYQQGNPGRAESLIRTILKEHPHNIQLLNILGVMYAQHGNDEAAIELFKKALQLDPANTDLYMNLGETLHGAGRLDEAVECYQKALEIDPDFVWGYFNTGLVLQDKGQLDEAIAQYLKSLQIDGNLFEAYYNLGLLFSEKQQFEEATGYYEKALRINPELADAYYNLGNIHRTIGQIEEAILSYQKALEINPRFPNAMNNLGIAFQDKGQLDDAIQSFQRTIQLDPGFLNTYKNLANALKEKGAFDEAIRYYRKAIQMDPAVADTFISLGTVYRETGRFDDAIEHYRKAIALDAQSAEAYYNLGNVLQDKGQFNEAIESFQKSLELNDTYAEAYNNMGFALQSAGHTAEALDNYGKAVQLNPLSPHPHWNMSYILLFSGDFSGGWRKYEWRFLTNEFAPRESLFTQPQWDGRPLKGAGVLVYAEQGIGDEIMFASCLPVVIAQAGQCLIECDRRLVPLFARSFPETFVIERLRPGDRYPGYLPPTDWRIAIGSLPKLLRQNLSSFPPQEAYLVPDAEKVETWHARFSHLGTGLKVGISWRGGSKPSVKLTRSTALSQWKELFSLRGVHFINLQYGDCSTELREAKDTLGITIHDWEDADPLKDLDNFAAQVAALDLVISVDNATVHMAGALGVPVWALLPSVCDWRWMRDFEDTPWYKTVRLIRQKNPGDWDGVFQRVASDLNRFLATGIMPEITHSYKSSLTAEPVHEPAAPVLLHATGKTYQCAVVTPVGPGHENLYQECLASVEKAFNEKPGNCAGIILIRIDDPEGSLGRSKARNLGIHKAAEQKAEWIFFLDADDLMSPSAFEYVSPYLDEHDAIWGSIWSIEQGTTTAKERPKQLPFLYGIEDVLSCDPFVSLQMGHFVRTHVALSVLFDESLDTGEDFDYYLRVWEKYRCIKIPLPFFYNRRGVHSHGPRSATGYAWRQQVDKMLSARYSSLRPSLNEGE